jgi:hypothetical protein
VLKPLAIVKVTSPAKTDEPVSCCPSTVAVKVIKVNVGVAIFDRPS